mmetsp:Transcript_109010/g.308267  ORF Transcript_109010/g.308267 Transcript_109010/m.308267 type:complete len:274 (-) Transcript_109010:455-1276(-)
MPSAVVFTEATLLDVSTSPSMAWDILTTPCGSRRSAATTRAESAAENAAAPRGRGAASTDTARPVSSTPNSSCMRPPRLTAAAVALAAAPTGAATTARASRGMALCLSPPSILMSLACGISASTSAARSPAMTIAFPRPSWILIPLCPPSRPPTFRVKATASPAIELMGAQIRRVELPPPAQPTYTLPNSSVSKFRSRFALTMLPSSPDTPVSPVSSSTVNSASIGGSRTSAPVSSTAKAAATPMPLSAPSVVPVARSQPRSRRRRMGSVAKS